jgi:hypothetical protein
MKRNSKETRVRRNAPRVGAFFRSRIVFIPEKALFCFAIPVRTDLLALRP